MFNVSVTHRYEVWCYDKDGKLKWYDNFKNLVTTEGLNHYLNTEYKGGTQDTTWFLGLVKAKTTGYAAGDTMASHGGWTEAVPSTDYTGNRQAVTFGTVSAGSVDNSASKASFPILTTLTIYGALLCTDATGTSGTLMGVGDFSGGSRSVINGDTLQVQVTCSIASA